jgi:serine/threonine-protein kinase
VKKPYWKTDWFIGLLVMLVFLLLADTPFIRSLEWHAYDLGMRFSSNKPASKDVVVVAIDDKSIQEIGAWPWPRDVLAEATRQLARARPEVIGFSMPFDVRQSVHGLEQLEKLQKVLKAERAMSRRVQRVFRQTESSMNTDQILASTFRTAGRIVLAMPYSSNVNTTTGAVTLPDYLSKFTLRDIVKPKQQTALQKWWQGEPVPVADVVYPPIEVLSRQVGGAGVINMNSVKDEHSHNVPLVIRYGDQYLPSFALMLAVRNQGLATSSIKVNIGDMLLLDDTPITTDKNLHIYPRFYKSREGEPTFNTYPIVDVINGQVPAEQIRDKTVIVGLTSRQYVAPLETPIGEMMPQTMINAHTVSSLLNKELYKVPEWTSWVQKAVIVVIGLYLMFLLTRFRISTGFVVSILLLIGILNAHFILMIAESTWLPLMAAAMTLIIGHLLLGAKRLLEENVQRVHTELSEANKLLGQSFHSQGQLDQAFEKYRRCEIDASVLNQLYNLGLDYERKRQFNKAVPVFKFIESYDPNYSDVKDRLNRNQEVSEAVVLGSGSASNSNGTLVISNSGMQKPMLGRYQIDKELGRGAMGMVYLGHDPKIGRTVAIKTMMLSQEFEGDKLDDVKKRFFREAETAGRLNHPNIVTVYDVGEDQELAYIAMDYLKGNDLMSYCKPETLLPARKVFDIVMHVAEALDYAHQQHVVHRDIKPANIIYDEESGTTKVTDFGVACLTDSSKTKTGTILGSPSYMSPEQLAGKKVDGRSDLFSLGVTLYQMLAGELPFIGDSLASLMYKITNEKHPDIRMFRPDLPACVSKLINKALHKDIERRFQSGTQMAASMQRCYERLHKTR